MCHHRLRGGDAAFLTGSPFAPLLLLLLLRLQTCQHCRHSPSRPIVCVLPLPVCP
jgi:hypothetical protein